MLALVILAAAAAVGISSHDEHTGPARLRAHTTGLVHISTSSGGGTMLRVDGLAPGASRDGTVTIGNDGKRTARLTLTQENLSDQPGPFGGLLSDVLALRLEELTPAGTSPVYEGALPSLPTTSFGTLPVGATRTFRFTVSFPDGGVPSDDASGDNRFQGSTVSVGYRWTGTATVGAGGPLITIGNGRRTIVLWKPVFLSVGVPVLARCSSGCALEARLLMPRRVAGSVRYVVAGRRAGGRSAPGQVRLTLRPRRAVRLRVSHARRLRFVVDVTMRDSGGSVLGHARTRVLVRSRG